MSGFPHRSRSIAAWRPSRATSRTSGPPATGPRASSSNSILSSTIGEESVAYAAADETYISRQAGPLSQTGDPLDVAVQGEAWLAIQTPDGTVYTRDGRMKMLETGELVSLNDHPVLDVGGAPLLLDPVGGPPQIARDGMITQGGIEIGAIGLFAIDPAAQLSRHENSGVVPDQPAVAVLDFDVNGVVQGFVEGANVNPVLELTKLIMVSRSFESASAAIEQSDQTLEEAIKTLGAV